MLVTYSIFPGLTFLRTYEETISRSWENAIVNFTFEIFEVMGKYLNLYVFLSNKIASTLIVSRIIFYFFIILILVTSSEYFVG